MVYGHFGPKTVAIVLRNADPLAYSNKMKVLRKRLKGCI